VNSYTIPVKELLSFSMPISKVEGTTMPEFTDFTDFTHDVPDEPYHGIYNRANPRVNYARPRAGRRAPEGFKLVPDVKPPPALVAVRIYAEHQLTGSLSTSAWESDVFHVAEQDFRIKSHEILYATASPWGLRFVTFTVDAEVPVGSQDQIRIAADGVLTDIFGHAYFEIRFITPLASPVK
jgi:hypothetical protein